MNFKQKRANLALENGGQMKRKLESFALDHSNDATAVTATDRVPIEYEMARNERANKIRERRKID